jgi:hypothetical protein
MCKRAHQSAVPQFEGFGRAAAPPGMIVSPNVKE